MKQRKKLGRKILGVLLTLAMIIGLMPGMSITAYAADATTLATDTTTWENGDYVVPEGGVTFSGHITVNGIVNLTLTEGATLTANMGITLSDGATLNVSGEGAMVVKGSNGNANSTVAGTGTLVLTSGTVTVTGGTAANVPRYGESSNAGGVAVNGSVTVNGGILNATGGVGGSLSSYTVRARAGAGGTAISGNVTVNAGTVTATGGNGGSDAAYAAGARAGDGGVAIGGDATINGGTWTATDGSAGAKGPSEDGMSADGTVGAGGASYNGTLTLGVNVKLYEGTGNNGTVLDENDSSSRVYSGAKKASMYAEGPDISQGPDKTALNDAITAAETLYNSIKDNTDYADIVSTFKTAINTAKRVAESDEVDQDVVDTATSNIITANTNAVIKIIKALPTASDVTTADRDVIAAVRKAYDALDDTQKALVDANTLKKLTDAEAALATIDQAAAGNVNTAIGNLPAATDVTTENREAIKAARDAYDALDDAQKKLVDADTLQKLTDAEAALATIDQTAAGNVTTTIGNLPAATDVTADDRADIKAAREAYDALDETQKKLVDADTLKKLTDAEAALATIDQTAAGNVTTTIGNLPAATDVTTENRAAIKAARDAYDALDDAQKKLVEADTLQKLTDAEAALATIDQTAAGNVTTTIGNLPAATDVTTENRAAIKAAREAYDALDETQKKLVEADTLQKLTDAEAALATIDQTAAGNVTTTIGNLPEATAVTTENREAIKAAREAYDALDETQKKLVDADTLKKLTDAEAALATIDQTAAGNVNTAIGNLPAATDVTVDSREAIEAARAAYDALDEAQKKLVDEDTLKKLTDTEKALKDAEIAKSATDVINALPASDKVATTDKAAIEAARKAYDALTEDQKKRVSADTLKKLTDAETALTAAEKKAAEDKAAKELAAAKQVAQAAMNSEVKVSVKGKKINVQWTKTTSADGYDVYVQYCGKKITKPVKTIKKNSTTKTTIKKINGKKLNLKKQFRVYVVAYKMIDGKKVKLAKSNTGHVVGIKNKKYTNVKSIKLTKKAYTIAVGKTAKVKAKIKLVDKKKKHIPKSHGAKFRYRTSDSSIATVSKSGQIKGIKKGTCTIYVYAINGKMKKVKVTVK